MNPIDWLSPIVSLLAILAALGKLFEIRAKVDANLAELGYRLHSLQKDSDHRDEVLRLSLNQVKEVAEHVRSRTRFEADNLETRLLDVEGYLEKNTPYERRHKSSI